MLRNMGDNENWQNRRRLLATEVKSGRTWLSPDGLQCRFLLASSQQHPAGAPA